MESFVRFGIFVDIKGFLGFLVGFLRLQRDSLYIVFIICINNEAKAFIHSLHPVELMFKLVDIRLVTNLARHNLLSEEIAHRNPEII